MQCCTCSNWVHLKCSLLSFSRFRTLGSSHSWSCPTCFFGDFTPINTVHSSSDFSSWYTSSAQSGLLLLMQHSHPTLAFKPLILFPLTLYLLALHPYHRLMILAVSLYLFSPRVLQWNAGGLQARSTELLHFISSHPVDLICIQESNLNLFSSFQIPGFSALRSDGTHSRSGIFSIDELSTYSLSSLDPYSDYVGVNISPNDSSSLLFLNVYAPPIRFSPKDNRTNFFSPSYVEAVEFSRSRIPGPKAQDQTAKNMKLLSQLNKKGLTFHYNFTFTEVKKILLLSNIYV